MNAADGHTGGTEAQAVVVAASPSEAEDMAHALRALAGWFVARGSERDDLLNELDRFASLLDAAVPVNRRPVIGAHDAMGWSRRDVWREAER